MTDVTHGPGPLPAGCNGSNVDGRGSTHITGSALVDAVVSVTLVLVALLSTLTIVGKGIEQASRSRWMLLAVSATEDVADSLASVGAQGGGARSLAPVTVRWSPVGGRLFRLEALAPDTTGGAVLEAYAVLPPPVP